MELRRSEMTREEQELINALKVIRKECASHPEQRCEMSCPLANQYGCIFQRDVPSPCDWELDEQDPLRFCFN